MIENNVCKQKGNKMCLHKAREKWNKLNSVRAQFPKWAVEYFT